MLYSKSRKTNSLWPITIRQTTHELIIIIDFKIVHLAQVNANNNVFGKAEVGRWVSVTD